MRLIRILARRLRSLLRRSRQEDELSREIQLHLEQLTVELESSGFTPAEARLEARRQFGHPESTKEQCRDMRRVRLLENIARDIAFALRLFRKSPGFTLTALLSLTLGIGANTAIFQLFDAIRLRLLPVERPSELVAIRINGEGRSGNFRGRNGQITNAIWQEFQHRQTAFAGVLAYGDSPLNLAPAGELRNVEGLWVSGSFFPVLGVRPHLGRLLSPNDDRPGCGWPGVVISHAFWQREFGADPNVLSRTLPIEKQAVPILGVTPPGFFGVEIGRRFDVAMPICSAPTADLNNRMFWFLSLMARKKPGISEEAVRSQLKALSPAVFEATIPPYQPSHQALFAKLQLDIAPGAGGQSGFREALERPLTFLLSIVVFVLLLACANLANMMLARATAREHEFAVRASLGASRRRLIAQVLIESVLLSIAGAVAGAFAAPAIGRLLVNMLSTARDPVFLTLDPNWRVFAFTIGASATATISFGLAPALRAARTAARGASADREKLVFRKVLLVTQAALSMILLTAAILFTRSFHNLLTADAGFEPSGILVTSTFFDAKRYPPDRRLPAIEELHQRLTAIPGVSAVARGYVIPISGSGWDRGARVKPTDPPRDINLSSVSEGYFRLMNTPLLAGRDFNSTDRPNTKPVAIVNQAFARVFFNGANPVGRVFLLDGLDALEPPFEIIGLASNAKYSSLAEAFTPIAYFAASQEKTPRLTVRYLLRTTSAPEVLMTPVRHAIAEWDPQLFLRFTVLKSQMEESVLRERLMASLTAAFAVLGTVLAMTGIFGVTAYVVARRRREFGIRIAIGATGPGIVRLVLGDLTRVLLLGILIGAALAFGGARVAATLLYGVKPNDPATFITVIVMLVSCGVVAGLIPALRASKIPPVEALR